MSQNTIQPSFSAGEFSPSMFGRVDLAKYRIGAARMRNFFVDYRGGASTRPGSHFVGPAKGEARLIPFQYSTVQAYVLEFSNLAMRVIKNGAYVLETPKNITAASQASPCQITSNAHGFSNGDAVYITGVGGMVELNGRTLIVAGSAANTFTLVDPLTGAGVDSTLYTAYTSGGTVARLYTLVTPYTTAQLATLKFTQSADVMTLTHPDQAPRELSRTGDAAWALTTVSMRAELDAPVGGAFAITLGVGTTNYAYKVTAVSNKEDESLPSAAITGAGANMAAVAATVTLTWTAVAGAKYYNVYKAIPLTGVAVDAGAEFGYIGRTTTTTFNDSNINGDFANQPPQHFDPFNGGPLTSVGITNGGAAYSFATTITVSDPTGTGAVVVPYVLAGVITSLTIVSAGNNYTSPTITAVDHLGLGGGFIGTAAAAAASSPPSCVTYFQQRIVYAASTSAPQTMWFSRPGQFHNFDVTNPTNDGDGMTFTLASQQVNAIRSMLPMPGGLVLLTSGGVWQLSGGGSGQMVTPTTAQAVPQAYIGASDVPPIAINYNILYVQKLNSVVRELQYEFFTSIYKSTDITVLSNHLFHDRTVKEWTYAAEPFKIIWSVMSDGKLLSLTYLKDQELMGWAQHDTAGTFESICSIIENNAVAVYVVVNRTINGHAVRYVEKFDNRDMTNGSTNAWCVDCGLDYNGSPAATITGLWHLEGATVSVLADGSYLTRTVTNGSITLAAAASRVIVGLGFQCQLQTLNLDVGEPTIQGKRKKIAAVTLRMENSRGLKVGPTFSDLTELKQVYSTFGVAPPLVTDDQRVVMTPAYRVDGRVCIQQDYPLPATVLAVIPEIVLGDST